MSDSKTTQAKDQKATNSKSKPSSDKKELDKFSKELLKRITVATKPSKSKGILGRVNPLVVLVTLLVSFFVIFSLFNYSSKTKETISINTALNGIKDNEYSKILIKNDGKVEATEKTIMLSEDVIESDSKVATEEKSLEDIFDKTKSQDLTTRIRNIVNNNITIISEVIIGDKFVITVVEGKEEKAYLTTDTTEEQLNNFLRAKDISLEDQGIKKIYLQTASRNVDTTVIEDRVQAKQIERIIEVDGLTIAEVKDDFVKSYKIDWTPSIYTFADFLTQQNVDLNSKDFELVTENVPSTITLSDVLTIFTIIIFIVLAVIIFRSAQSSGMGLMQFGQSKARMFFGQKTDTTFKDVAGIDEAREELNEIVDFLRNPNKYRKLGARIPKGILMVGAPGTGKTLLARAIAGEAAVPFFHTSGSEFEEMLVGAGASRVRDLFAKAKKAAPALIFIDEIDAVARKRGTRIQSGSTEQTLNQILVEMDGFEKNTNVIVIAATNRPDVLDPAILRPGRFDRQVRIDVPDKEGRKQILEIHGKNKPFAKDVDLDKVAKRTVGFTGADLENILNEAAIIAAKDGKHEITNHDIEEAVSKVMLGPAKKSRKRTDDELKLVAYHEAGHALVAKLTPGSIPVDKISIISRGSSGGVTMFLPEKDENIVSKSRLIADITVSLGGRAAEEVALDDISTGASSDIQKATNVARRMIQKFGMSKKLGLVQYGQSMDSEYLGYAYGDEKDYSEKTAEEIDNEVREIVGEAYNKAIKIMQDNRPMLDKIASLLLEKEVLDKEEFEKLFV